MGKICISLDKSHIFIDGSGIILADTFDCGQCFRWNFVSEGKYIGVVNGKVVIATQTETGFSLEGENISEDVDFWKNYFDLDTDYDSIIKNFDKESYIYKAAEAGKGIHILRQDPWEVLVSFIISANNNITRIKKIIEKLCQLKGTPIEYMGQTYYTFPTPKELASITPEEIAELHAGYRDRYLSTLFDKANNGFSASELTGLDNDTLRKELLSILGVGNKVCDCIMLFGYSRYSAFPKDVWIKRVIKEHLGDDFSEKDLGEYAGVIQQYLFHYARNVIE